MHDLLGNIPGLGDDSGFCVNLPLCNWEDVMTDNNQGADNGASATPEEAKQRSVSKSLTIVDVQVAYEIDKKRWYLPRFIYRMVADDFGKTTFSKNGEVVVTMLKVPRPDLQFVVNDLAKKDEV